MSIGVRFALLASTVLIGSLCSTLGTCYYFGLHYDQSIVTMQLLFGGLVIDNVLHVALAESEHWEYIVHDLFQASVTMIMVVWEFTLSTIPFLRICVAAMFVGMSNNLLWCFASFSVYNQLRNIPKVVLSDGDERCIL